MATNTIDPGLTRAQLIEVARTGRVIKGVAKMRALTALQQRARKDVGDVLLQIATNGEEEPRYRHLAVMGLYRMGGTRAREALMTAAEDADADSAAAIATGLGRIGTPDGLAVVERLVDLAPSYAKNRVQFAATLLAYRHALDGFDVKAPTGKALQDLGRRKSQPIEVHSAGDDDATQALAALVADPLDVDLTTDRAVHVDCEPNRFVWLWTKESAAGGFAPFAKVKGVAGVLFRKRLFEEAYTLSAIGLVTPMSRQVRMTLHRAESGAVVYVGNVTPDGAVDVKARNRPGMSAVNVSARVDAGGFEIIKARSAVNTIEARAPKPHVDK